VAHGRRSEPKIGEKVLFDLFLGILGYRPILRPSLLVFFRVEAFLLKSQPMEFVLSVIIGGLITILTAIGVEYLRRPRLTLSIEDPPLDLPSPDGKNMRRNLRLKLHNASLPFGARWMQRAAAIQCRGEITFHHLNDGQNVFGRAMPVRWVKSPEPIANQICQPRWPCPVLHSGFR
jgi:hypothetical protein